MSSVSEDHVSSLKELGLKEYHAKVLAHLMELGESKAQEVSSASEVPRSRVYGVLEDLADRGLVEIKPGRPTKFLPRHPEEVVRRMIHNKREEMEREIEKVRNREGEIKSKFQPLFESRTERTRGPLFKTVSVGETSERETQLMYGEAENEIDIVTKSMEWYPRVEGALRDASEGGVEISILFLSPEILEDENVPNQRESMESIRENLPESKIKFSNFLLPLRGSIVDPSYDYSSGKAIFLVEEREVPLTLRDAAITENPSLVAGMKRYFDLIWKCDSSEVGEFLE